MTTKIIQGDCLEVMKTLPDNSVDSIVTDPPYELGFMGKKWDNTGIANNISMWKEAFRVLKPGGHLLSFGGTRTYHRMACAIEDAGFEIRDQIQWLYGSGFPKSLNIGKAIDKKAEENTEIIKAKQELGKWLREKRGKRKQNEISKYFPSKTGGLTGCVANWELGFNIPTWDIWTKLKGILELDDRFDYLIEGRPNNFIEAEREVIGKNNYTIPKEIYNIGKEKSGERDESLITAPATPEAKEWEGWGTALKPANEPIVLARKPLSEKNVALNVLKWGTGGINIDGCRVAFKDNKDKNKVNNPVDGKIGYKHHSGAITGMINRMDVGNPQGRFPANIILDEEAGDLLDQQSGVSKSNGGSGVKSMGALGDSKYGNYNKKLGENAGGLGDKGGASRFFYCAKTSKSERNAGCEDMEYKAMCEIDKMGGSKCSMKTGSGNERNVLKKNNHPTVKPIKLMKYLCRLITPKGGTILDPFTGSGSTGIGAIQEGFNFIGIEREEEYIKIAEERIKPYLNQKRLF